MAYCTLVASDDHLVGAEALILSLLAISYPLPRPFIVVHLRSLDRRQLARLEKLDPGHVRCLAVEPVRCSAAEQQQSSQEGADGAASKNSWHLSFTKLRIWEVFDEKEFPLVMYLDADTVVLQDLEHLFLRDVSSLGFAAAPDVFPPDRFNAGVLLLKPSKEVFQEMLSKLALLPSYDSGDTGFLNAFFPQWFESPSNCRLGFAYNAQRTMYYMTKAKPGYWKAIEPIKVLHYSSTPKPWQQTSNKLGELEIQWWHMYTTNTMMQNQRQKKKSSDAHPEE